MNWTAKYESKCEFHQVKVNKLLGKRIAQSAFIEVHCIWQQSIGEKTMNLKRIHKQKNRGANWPTMRFKAIRSALFHSESYSSYSMLFAYVRWCSALFRGLLNAFHRVAGRCSGVAMFDGIQRVTRWCSADVQRIARRYSTDYSMLFVGFLCDVRSHSGVIRPCSKIFADDDVQSTRWNVWATHSVNTGHCSQCRAPAKSAR